VICSEKVPIEQRRPLSNALGNEKGAGHSPYLILYVIFFCLSLPSIFKSKKVSEKSSVIC